MRRAQRRRRWGGAKRELLLSCRAIPPLRGGAYAYLNVILIFVLLIAGVLSVYPSQVAQNFDNVQIKILPVQGNIYMAAGAGGNITLQVGKEGILLVDTEYGPLAPR